MLVIFISIVGLESLAFRNNSELKSGVKIDKVILWKKKNQSQNAQDVAQPQ